jgi:hypothetical protein
MSKGRTLGGIALGIVACGGLIYLIQIEKTKQASASARQTAEVAELRRELQAVSERVSDNRNTDLQVMAAVNQGIERLSEQGTAPVPTASSSAAVEARNPHVRETPEQIKQRLDEEIAKISADLDAVLEQQPRDANWGHQVSNQVRDVFAADTTTKVTETECRSNLCRVVLIHDSLATQHNLGKDLVDKPPFDQEVFFDYDRNAVPPTTTLYVGRQGTSLAKLIRPEGSSEGAP